MTVCQNGFKTCGVVDLQGQFQTYAVAYVYELEKILWSLKFHQRGYL